MNISADCMSCIINGQLKHILPLGNEATRTEYMRNVLRIIADGSETLLPPGSPISWSRNLNGSGAFLCTPMTI